MEQANATFEGWALIELFGHQREVGFVTTQIFGQACLFRVDVPEIPERDFTLEKPEWIGASLAREGSKVRRAGVQGCSRLVGPGAVYAINPCSEQRAMQEIERMYRPPLQLIEAAPQNENEKPALLPGEMPRDRTFACCGGNPEDGHKDWCEETPEDDEP